MAQLTIVGLGYSNQDDLTPRATNLLLTTPDLFVTIPQHPVVRWLAELHRPVLQINTVARGSAAPNAVIVAKLLVKRVVAGRDVVLAAPGSPLSDDLIARAAFAESRRDGVPIAVIVAPSYLDGSLSAGIATELIAGLQVAGHGHQRSDIGPSHGGSTLMSDPFLGVYRDVDPTRSVFFGPLFEAADVEEVRTQLADLLPIDHPVVVVRFGGGTQPATIDTTTHGVEWDGSSEAMCVLTTPLERLEDTRSFDTLRYAVARLRAPTGCPWDREQTYATIKKHLVEETYEAIAALDDGDLAKLAEELGDVLLQVVMYGQFGRELGDFTIDDVLRSVNEKLVRRHPHVFGDLAVTSSAEVLRNWERIKRSEKSGAASTFSGIPIAAPALVRAEAIQSRASRYGWIARASVDAGTIPQLAADDLGQLLFDVVTLARRSHLDAEELLRQTTNRFCSAFDLVLAACHDEGINFDDLPPEERARRLNDELGRRG
jgi:tetrapyrrole methylase family protein/MazG family protein